jgi:hypothetical protein
MFVFASSMTSRTLRAAHGSTLTNTAADHGGGAFAAPALEVLAEQRAALQHLRLLELDDFLPNRKRQHVSCARPARSARRADLVREVEPHQLPQNDQAVLRHAHAHVHQLAALKPLQSAEAVDLLPQAVQERADLRGAELIRSGTSAQGAPLCRTRTVLQ